MLEKYISKLTPEEKFSIAVLHTAKESFGKSAKYLQTARMVKLVALVADEIGYDLTKGWYKYGYYSPSVHHIALELTAPEHPNLITFKPPEEFVRISLETFKIKLPLIESTIENLEQFFVRGQSDFLTWVYKEKAPEKYRDLYLTHLEFKNFLNSFVHYLKSPEVWKIFFDKLSPRLEYLVTKYHNVVKQMKDEEILWLFYNFMDLLEMVALRIENKEYTLGYAELAFLDELKNCYSGEDKDIWMLLVPYSETLTGPMAKTERERYKHKIRIAKATLNLTLEDLTDNAKSLDLFPSFNELETKINKFEEKFPDRKPIREIYASL